MKTNVERKRLVKKLDQIVSKIVIARDGKCVVCGSTQNLTCGHLFSRVHYSTRWSLTNCNCQCLGCNLKHEHNWEPYRRWFVQNYGQAFYDALYEDHMRVKKFKNYELQELLEELKGKYEEMV